MQLKDGHSRGGSTASFADQKQFGDSLYRRLADRHYASLGKEPTEQNDEKSQTSTGGTVEDSSSHAGEQMLMGRRLNGLVNEFERRSSTGSGPASSCTFFGCSRDVMPKIQELRDVVRHNVESLRLELRKEVEAMQEAFAKLQQKVSGEQEVACSFDADQSAHTMLCMLRQRVAKLEDSAALHKDSTESVQGSSVTTVDGNEQYWEELELERMVQHTSVTSSSGLTCQVYDLELKHNQFRRSLDDIDTRIRELEGIASIMIQC